MKVAEYRLSKKEWEELIEQWIVGRNAERDREIMRQKIVIGITFLQVAEMFDLSKQRVEQIVYARMKEITSHIAKT